jgi:hypothetical protein
MADYYKKVRTNYFSVTDEDKFRQLMSLCAGDENSVEVFTSKSADGNDVRFGFGCRGSILGLLAPYDNAEPEDLDYETCDDEHDMDLFYKFLQKLVAKDDAVIITEVGSEKLCYLFGISAVITNSEIRVVSLQDIAIAEARAMLGNVEYTTQMDY